MLIVFDNREFIDNNEELAAHWEFSGDPCPVAKYEMAIQRVDGLVVSPMEEVSEGSLRYINIFSTKAVQIFMTVKK